MIAGGVVAAVAAAVASAVTAADVAVGAVADLRRKHGTGIKGMGGRPTLAADIGYPSVTSGPSC